MRTERLFAQLTLSLGLSIAFSAHALPSQPEAANAKPTPTRFRTVWINDSQDYDIVTEDNALYERLTNPKKCVDYNLKTVLKVLKSHPDLEVRLDKELFEDIKDNRSYQHADALGIEVKRFRRPGENIFMRGTGSAIVFQPVSSRREDSYLLRWKNESDNKHIAIVYGKKCLITEQEIESKLKSEIDRIHKLNEDRHEIREEIHGDSSNR